MKSKFIDEDKIPSSEIVHFTPSFARRLKVLGPMHSSGGQRPFGRTPNISSILSKALLLEFSHHQAFRGWKVNLL